MKTGRKFITALALFSIFAQSAILPLSKTLVYAQEITATPTEAFSPTPLISPTTEITSSVSPALTPEASLTPQVTPTQDILDGVSTIAPTEESTPQPQPTEEPKNNSPPTQGDEHIEAIVLSNVSAPSLDLSTQESAGSASVSTDKADYAPTDTALITGSGFNPGETYLLYITSSDEPAVNFKTEVKADENGSFAYAYQLDGNYRPNYKVEVKDSSGNVVVLTTFTDSDSGFVAPNQTIASSSVSNPDNGWLSDDNRATFNNSNDTSDYGFPELGIPAGATIDGIEVTIEAQRSGNRDLAASLWNISNNNPDAYTNDKTATLSGSDSVQTLGGPTDKWGETWTVSDFSDADFKIRIGATGGNNEALLDQVRVKVYYTEEAPVCTAPPSGMTSWWPADGNTDDIVGTNNGTAVNGATFASGKVDQAFSFDGTNDLVAASNVGDFGSDPFTVDFWMKSNNDGSSNPTFIVGKNHADDGLGWDIRLSNSTIRVYGVNGWSLNIASDASATPNVWHHIALASTGTTVNLYIDGVLKGTSPRSAITSTSNPFRIGFTTNFQSPAFNGLIDEVEIFNRALSLSEIQAIYNADSAGKCKTEASPTPTPTPSPTPPPDLNWPTSWTTPSQCSTDGSDESPSEVDLLGTSSNPAAGFGADSNYMYFRERIEGNPGTVSNLNQFSWVVLFQTSQPQYQYLGAVTGKGGNKVQLWNNTVNSPDSSGVDFSPLFNDPADSVVWEGDSSSYSRVTSSGGIYFIDWAIPLTELASRGITINSTKFFATSANANNYNKDHLNCYEAIADLSVAKADSQDPVNAGASLTYTITVTNSGPDSAQNVVVTDNLPTEIVALSLVSSSQGSCSDTTLPSPVQCELGTINNGSSATMTVTGTVSTNASGTIRNSVSVVSDTLDTNTGNNSDTEDTEVTNRGTLIVQKNVINDNGGNKAASDFSFQVDGGIETPFESNGINYVYVDAGTYDVTEPSVTGYTTSYNNCSNVVISSGGTQTCYITNNDIQPLLTVTKVVENRVGSNGQVSDFPLFVNTTEVISGVQNGFNAGIYGISETTQPGYTAVISGDCNPSSGSISLNVGDVKSCTITNTRDTGRITIDKIVEGGDVPSSNWSFNILGDQGTVASDLHDGDSITLPTGTYTISESTIAGYTLTGVSGACSDINSSNATLTVIEEGGTCTLTNTQDPVSVRGFKYFDVDQNGSYDGDDYPLENWTLCLYPDGNNQGYPISPSECQTTGADGFVEWTVPVGPAYDSDGFGAYHGLWMQESNQDGWTNTFPPNGGFNVDVSFNQRGEVLYRYYDGESHYVDIPRFGNWQVPAGSVKVNKLIDADGDGEFESDNNEANGLGFSWGLDFEEPFRAMGETADPVDAGDHTVSENEVESYHFVGWYYTNDDFGACEETTDDEGNELGPNGTTLPADFNVSNGETTEITLCNARNKGTITIDKVTNPEGDQTTFDINLIEAESIVHTSLLSDADIPDTYAVLAGTYNLEELSRSGWDLTDANCTVNGGFDFDPRTESFDVSNEDEISCTFTNTKRGEITVIKYHDKNANGQKDEGEENLGGWNINLSDGEGNSSSQATSREGEDLGQASFNDLTPQTYTLSEDLQEGWTQSEITCDDNPSFIDGVTAFFEGGHQVTVDPGQTVTCEIGNYQNAGQITGQKWNDENGDGRKCLLESPIADLGCEPGLPGWHIRLFEDNDGSIGGQVGNDELTNQNGDFSFDSVNPGSYWLCEVNQAEWSQTYPNNDSQNPRCWEINLSSNGEVNGRDFGNQQQQNPVLTISKINNKTGIDLTPGNDVTYALTIEATQSAVKNVKVTDLLPSGFKYRGGSWTATLNGLPISIPEPVYASPGVWQVGDMNVNDKVVLSYIADIDGGQQPGLYKDVAWAEGTSLNSDQVLANAIIPGKVDDNFVGTDINVVKETQSGVSIDIETKKTEEVLGASTSLPATGGNTIWIIIASMMLATGFSSMILGLRLKPKKRSKHV